MAGSPPDWQAIHDRLVLREPTSLSAAELDRLGESLFWLDRPEDSIAVLGRAFTAHLADGDHAGAAMAAWQLFYDHALVGEMALARGWLERTRRETGHAEDRSVAGFLAVAESDLAAGAGALEDAVTHAERAVELGRATGHADLTAMALQAKGRALVACGRVDDGITALDEAMVAVVNGELTPLFTGWVYCNALSTCHDLADLSRAIEWTDSAMRWCDDLQAGRLYPGICRLHVVELATLRGAWETAALMAQQACDELTSHDPRYAGEAHYLIGELHRMAGDLDLAEEAFTRAHRLGRVPQPGLARVRLAQGRLDAAVNGLRLALEPVPVAPLRRTELLAALVEAHLAAGDVDAAAAGAAAMAGVVGAAASVYLDAVWRTTEAQVLLARGDGLLACRRAGEAVERFQGLSLPYDEARAREARGAAARVIDELDTAQLELTAARDTYRRLGAELDERRVAALLGDASSSPLSSREIEVLRLVARGGTNREVAGELVVSEHTVARHLSNIYTKLGVGSRSAATAWAYERSLI
ncbi:MAG TPA: helix-turn-helix transcriptional regulator [Egibacteraceae bacterium]|nr:helix-turn-helix transcriptional regulator [Egibacteraceae bacterium]